MLRISARARQQIFLSRGFAFHGKWSVAAGDDGQEDAAEIVTLCCIPKFPCAGFKAPNQPTLFLAQPGYSTVLSIIDGGNESVSLLPELA